MQASISLLVSYMVAASAIDFLYSNASSVLLPQGDNRFWSLTQTSTSQPVEDRYYWLPHKMARPTLKFSVAGEAAFDRMGK